MVQGEAFAALRQLPDDTFDAVITDPPYSSGGQFRGDRAQTTRTKYVGSDTKHDIQDFTGDNRDQRAFLAWCTLWLSEAHRILKPGRAIALFTDWRQLPTMSDALQAGGFVWRGMGVWKKTTGRPSPGIYNGLAEYIIWGTKGPTNLGHEVYIPTVIEGGSPRGDDRVHQTQKPLGIMEKLATLAPPGGTIVDPFAGSGTTLVAARNTGRHALGIELSHHFANVCADRLKQAPLITPPTLDDEHETLSLLG